MAEFRRKITDDSATLALYNDKPDGTSEQMDLVYRCPLKDYVFTKTIMSKAQELKEIEEIENTGFNIKYYDDVMEKTKAVFELMAPGKWDDIFDFLGNEILTIAEVVQLMIETVVSKGVESKQAEIMPVLPEDGETV